MIFIKDKEFIRGNCPMTKEDIRLLSVAKLNLESNSNILDIGSGTGTITVQCSKLAYNGEVYSVEKDDEAFDTTMKNIKKFKCNNVHISKDEAINYISEIFKDKGEKSFLNSIFIGGSGGNVEEIIIKCYDMLLPSGVLVMNFITLNNAYKAMETVKKLNFKTEMTLVNISKNREGTYMMIANNPIFIVQCIKEENK